MYFTIGSKGNKEKRFGFEAVLLTADTGISHTVTAFIEIQRRAHWLPSRRPDAFPVIDIEIPSAGIHRNAIVAVAEDSAEFCILVEAVSAGCL